MTDQIRQDMEDVRQFFTTLIIDWGINPNDDGIIEGIIKEFNHIPERKVRELAASMEPA